MKILHLSHNGLPDARVEKNAMTMKKKGHEFHFLSGIPSKSIQPFSTTSTAFYKNDVAMIIGKYDWHRAIRKIDPDIIHAHNIFACRITFGLDHPVVYDDHEWWTRNFPIYFALRKPYAKLVSVFTLLSMRKWEQKAIQSYPTLTVHERIAESHRREYDGWVRSTPNFPSLLSVSQIPNNDNREGSVYLGSDARKPNRAEYRNMKGLPEKVVFDSIYGLDYKDMLTKLTDYKIGLIPWNNHPLHHYACPAKAYDYLHAGLQVISPRTMSILKGNPYVHFFDTLNEIPSIIEEIEYDDIDPDLIRNHARQNCIWETQENKIYDAYEEAFRRDKN